MDTAAARGFIFEEGFTLDDFFFEMVGRNLGIPLPLGMSGIVYQVLGLITRVMFYEQL